MIELLVIFCMKLNPYMCKTLEMVPDDGHQVASQMECIKGGAVGGMTFMLEYVEYQVKGWRCIETPNVMQTWLRQRR
jgi:hypothetical protein